MSKEQEDAGSLEGEAEMEDSCAYVFRQGDRSVLWRLAGRQLREQNEGPLREDAEQLMETSGC